jgi:uncharacterized OB-fold protein
MTTNRSPILIELHCRNCGRAYVPTREDLARGPEVYHRCPECRPPAARDPEVPVE